MRTYSITLCVHIHHICSTYTSHLLYVYSLNVLAFAGERLQDEKTKDGDMLARAVNVAGKHNDVDDDDDD